MSTKSLNYILKNTRILEEYRDKCYVNNVLCQKSSEYYGRLKMLISIPLIILSSIMTVMNSAELNSSSIDIYYMRIVKILNIILNSFTVLLISFNNTFKISEKHNQFRILSIKYIKLCHVLEDNLVYSINQISHNTIFELVVEYDNLNESLEYSFPDHIKRAVKKMYKNKKTLPNILNCETDFIHDQNTLMENININKANDSESPLTRHFKKRHDYQLAISRKLSNDFDIENNSLTDNSISPVYRRESSSSSLFKKNNSIREKNKVRIYDETVKNVCDVGDVGDVGVECNTENTSNKISASNTTEVLSMKDSQFIKETAYV